jgi:hypothetical protein
MFLRYGSTQSQVAVITSLLSTSNRDAIYNIQLPFSHWFQRSCVVETEWFVIQLSASAQALASLHIWNAVFTLLPISHDWGYVGYALVVMYHLVILYTCGVVFLELKLL